MLVHFRPSIDNSTWHQRVEGGFNDLIISWNALRPIRGKFSFYVRVKLAEWSSWFCLAVWGRNSDGTVHQRSVSYPQDSLLHLDVDTLSLSGENLANEFEVKVVCEEGAHEAALHSLWASVSRLEKNRSSNHFSMPEDRFVISGVPRTSQLEISHTKARAMCSPASTWMVIRFLQQQNHIGHHGIFLDFADEVYDQNKHIYGNWVLNVAAAYNALQGRFSCYACRLSGFNELFKYLRNGIPAVVSFKGPIKGSADGRLHLEGHLIVVKGWNGQKKQVICEDPAFSSTHETEICYDFNEFMQAWERRYHLAYLFQVRT